MVTLGVALLVTAMSLVLTIAGVMLSLAMAIECLKEIRKRRAPWRERKE